MAKKYYAVKNGKGGVSGVYLTWPDCKAQVDGVKGVRYKSFPTMEEAEAFLRESVPAAGRSPAQKERQKAAEPLPREGAAVAYVDGSYHKGTKEFSCGAVLFYEREKLLFSQKYNDPDLADMHNVAGEIMGAVTVIRYCLEHGISALEIHHDYEGVAKWARGEWKANKPGTQAYAAECREARKRLDLTFVKVKGHSGDTYNDLADLLAKKALGIA